MWIEEKFNCQKQIIKKATVLAVTVVSVNLTGCPGCILMICVEKLPTVPSLGGNRKQLSSTATASLFINPFTSSQHSSF